MHMKPSFAKTPQGRGRTYCQLSSDTAVKPETNMHPLLFFFRPSCPSRAAEHAIGQRCLDVGGNESVWMEDRIIFAFMWLKDSIVKSWGDVQSPCGTFSFSWDSLSITRAARGAFSKRRPQRWCCSYKHSTYVFHF